MEINEAIEFLKINKNVLHSTPPYKEFLQKYGSIYGSDLSMIGPIFECYKGYKVQNLVSKNNTFGDFCKNYEITEEELKFYWLIGKYKNKFYYIDSSDDGKGHIYSLDPYSGTINLFSEDFLGFLKKIFSLFTTDLSNYESENVDSD